METPVRIPQAGTAAEASLIQWSVEVGARVEANQVLGEAETDKVTIEIVAPCAGVVTSLLVRPGDEVPISEPVAMIETGHTADVPRMPTLPTSPPAPGATMSGATETGGDRTRIESLSAVRRRIAENLQWVADHTVRASSTIEADFEPIAQLRERYGARFRLHAGFALTPLPFVARAVCATLPAFPDLQASLDLERGQITFRSHVHLGIAVAHPQGLRVAVIRDAHDATLPTLSRTIRRLADRAREGTLEPSDMQGGTFTITNPGALGSAMSSPVMNRGETAILSLDAVEARAVVRDGAIAIRHRAYLTLAFDHRVVDGSVAIAFLRAVEEHLASAGLASEAAGLVDQAEPAGTPAHSPGNSP